jgi:mono/diheme cytochrome c family protein
MIFPRTNVSKSALLGLVFCFFSLTINAQGDAAAGKTLFQQNCQTCHALDKDLVGPALRGFNERGPWADRKELYKWVHNPASYIQSSAYAKALQQKMGGAVMQPFPAFTEKQIDDIAEYIITAPAPGSGGGKTGEPTTAPAPDGGGNAIIFGVISIILALFALILMQVNNNLKKLSDDKEGIVRPEQVPFWKNKVYIALLALIFFTVGGYFVAKGAIGLGRQQGYSPTQPIYYSHKVHAGINQINCLYCHGSAWESKHAGIPTLNICMNCHKAISTYEKGPKLYDENNNEINGTAEIAKLYKYAGYTAGQPWNPENAKSPEWVKIHNLPDHVYFSHAQHVNAGKVACQSCHGNIQEMDKVSQVAELSMGWCINCHRETKVNFFNSKDSSGNKFYSIYEKFHNDIRNHKMDSVTVKDIGGTECQKCHY